MEVGLFVHHLPVDMVPPLLHKRLLPGDAIVRHVNMLPDIHTQYWDNVGSTWRVLEALLGLKSLLSEAICRVLEVLPCRLHSHGRRADSRVEVNLLAPPVGAGVGRPSQVRGQNLEGSEHTGLVGLDEPDKTGPEHGHGRVENLFPQRLNGPE